MTAPRAVLLLPAAEAFGAQRLAPDGARALGRSDRLSPREPGSQPQLLRHFKVLPRRLSVAALTRQADAGDAAGHAWLRADPAHIRPDINGARLLACGEALGLHADAAAQLLRPLKPLFGDAGFPIDAPAPSRWYLRLPLQARLPDFAPPSEALGADLFEHMLDGAEGRRWRALLNEAQVVLHNHPWNQARAAQGLPTVNSLWFWGAGVLPDRVASGHRQVSSDDEALRALAAAAGTRGVAAAPGFAVSADDALFDLRGLRDLRLFAEAWLAPALAALERRELETLELDLADGRGYRMQRGQRWRFWRRPQAALE